MAGEIKVRLEEYPGWLLKKQKQFPFAASRALNDTAFELRRDLLRQAQSDLSFRKSPRAGLGISVGKSTKGNLEAVVSSSRGWLTHQIQSGTNRPVKGIRYRGKPYLLIVPKERKTGRGKIKGITKTDTTFIQKSQDGHLLLMARRGKRRDRIRPIGILVPQSEYADDFDWEKQSEETIDRFFRSAMAKSLEKALRTAR